MSLLRRLLRRLTRFLYRRQPIDAGRVSLQPIAWAVRYHSDTDGDSSKFSPYFANSHLTMDDAMTACIGGFAFEGVSSRTKDELMKALASIGAKRVMFTRVRHVVLEDGTVELVPKTTTIPVRVKIPDPRRSATDRREPTPTDGVTQR